MSTIEIVDPRAEFDQAGSGAGPALAPDLAGVVVGMFTDDLWPSYDWVAEAWTAMLESRGAKVVNWRASQAARHDGTGQHVPADYVPLAAVLSDVDFVLVGLGNCGSCTSRTIDDTVEVLDAGVGAAAIVTSEFTTFAKILAKRAGWVDMRIHVLPYPLVTLTKAEIEAIATEQFDDLLATCRSGR